MAATEVIKTAFEPKWGMVDSTLEGFDVNLLAQQPNGQSNSAAWLLWHMTRVVDVFINARLQPKPQAWINDGWYLSRRAMTIHHCRAVCPLTRVGAKD